jgi:hypothetical protein
MIITCATSQKWKRKKEKTIVCEIIKCRVYTRLVNSWICIKNVPKFHQVNVLGKIVGYEPMTLTSPTYGLMDQNVTHAWL